MSCTKRILLGLALSSIGVLLMLQFFLAQSNISFEEAHTRFYMEHNPIYELTSLPRGEFQEEIGVRKETVATSVMRGYNKTEFATSPIQIQDVDNNTELIACTRNKQG